MKVGLTLIKNVLPPLGLTAAVSTEDAGIHKKIPSSVATTLITSNKEMKDIVRKKKPLENSGLLIKCATQTTENETREQRSGFLDMLLGTLGISLLGNSLAG